MRAFLRLLILLGVLLSGTMVAPTAFADEGSGTTQGTTEGTTAVDDPSGSDVPAGPGDPLFTATTKSQDPTVTGGLGAPQTLEASDAAPVLAPETTITSGPPAISTTGSATFGFEADQPAARFVCTLKKNAAAAVAVSCPAAATSTDPTKTRGSRAFSGLTVGTYTFTVQAVVGVAPASVPDPTPDSLTWRIGATVFSPDHYAVPAGATFNNPTGSSAAQRRNLTHVIRTINSMPGVRVSSQSVCDPNAAAAPSRIRITLYSATDMAFAKALVEAARRCVSVQILMNNHLGPGKTPAIRYMQNYLGGAVRTAAGVRRTFAHRCNYGCRGGGVLHSKFYLFDSSVTAPGGTRISDVVMVGSSNMTSNASRVQWNDLYTVRNATTLYGQYDWMFVRMQRDKDERRTFQFVTGPYQTTFTPQTPGRTDPTVSALRSIHCVGASGAGVGGRSVVYINMHAWFGTRGYGFAKQVRAMYDRGCHVKVLYSFMSRSVYKKLTKGTGSRMSVRRTIFSKHGGIHATLYSHFKMIAATGYVGTNRAASVVWTGSNNFTNDGPKFDEVTMRIASRAAFAQYRNQFAFITRTRSSGSYASFAEPIGGGRAVR